MSIINVNINGQSKCIEDPVKGNEQRATKTPITNPVKRKPATNNKNTIN